jgi:hypothetical protein
MFRSLMTIIRGKVTTDAIRYRINREIKLLYSKKQNTTQRLYHVQLEGTRQFDGMWQHIQNYLSN